MSLMETVRGLLGRRAAEIEQSSADRQRFLEEAAEPDAWRIDAYDRYERYYDGEQETPLTDRAKAYLERSGLPYTENFCEAIVDIAAERTLFRAFEVLDNEPAATWLSEHVWPRAGGPELQSIVHTETYKLGDGFVLVDFDPVRDRPMLRWHHPRQIKPVYGDDGELLYVVKRWATDRRSPTNEHGRPIERMNLYYPGRVEKWFAVDQGGPWIPHLDEGDLDGETGRWPVWWTTDGTETGEPLGIPLVHFRNKAKGDAFGRSELRGVIPQQDALNKQCVDLFHVMDQQGWPQRWGSGVSDQARLSVAIGEYLTTPDPAARFGEFAAADPRPALDAIEGTLRRMAARSRTPLHMMMMGGSLPSGETLKTAESPLVHKVTDRQGPLGGSWGTVGSRCVTLQNAFGAQKVHVEPDTPVTVAWVPPESRNDRDEAETLLLHEELGVSRATILRKLGYDPDEEAQPAPERPAGFDDEDL